MVLGTALRVANRCDQLASIRFTQNGESLSIAETLALRFLGNLFEPNSIGLQAEDIIDDLTHRDTTERDLLEYFRRYLGRLY